MCEKYYIWNPSICTCKNGNYSVITCDEILELTKATWTQTVLNKTFPKTITTKMIPINFNEKR